MNLVDDLETRELRYFVTVAEELNFGRAARRLGIAQPPLSRAIRRLETRLGVALLHRTTRSVALTEAGLSLLADGRTALDSVAAAGRRARRAVTPELLVTVKPGGEGGLLEAVLRAYGAERAQPPARVVVGGWGEQTAMLRDGRADVAILRSPFDTRGLDVEPLLTELRVAVLPRSHRLARQPGSRLADLTGEPTPHWPDADDDAAAYWDGRDSGSTGRSGSGVAPGPVVNDLASLLQVVAYGQAVAFLPASFASQYPHDGVAYVPVRDLSPSTVVVAWPEASRSLAVAAFVRAAVDAAAEHRGSVPAEP